MATTSVLPNRHCSRALRWLWWLATIGAVAGSAAAQTRPLRPPPRAQIAAFADRTEYRSTESAQVLIRMVVEDGWHVQSHTPDSEWLIPTVLEIEPPSGWTVGEIVYPPDKPWRASFQTEPLVVYEGESFLHASLEPTEEAASGDARIVLRYQACDPEKCEPPTTAETVLRLEVGDSGAPANQAVFARAGAGAAATTTPGDRGLLTVLLIGVLGGLILNAMPCVLPVLSLKVFGLVREAGSGTRAVSTGALATALGIVVSFWALALAAVATRAAGNAVGWGIQFQNPGFVAFLVVVLVFFAFNLWGLFEVQLPSVVIGLGGKPRGGYAGHFAAGLFATLMATPCSAPFLGTAVGFALSQTTGTILMTFTAIGLGMALPYLLVAAAPRSMAWLPRPGAWMETLKGILGFLLAGTAIWLLYVLNAQITPVSLALFEGALLVLGLIAWLRGRVTPHSARARVGTVAMLLCSLLAVVVAARADARHVARVSGSSRLDWQPFDPQAAQQLAADGHLVFVDVTADWCATCKVNEQLVLESDAVVALFERHQVIAMRADWTNRNDEIATYLAEHGRFAIPFYVLYRPDAEPYVFSQLLTRGGVADVIERSDRG